MRARICRVGTVLLLVVLTAAPVMAGAGGEAGERLHDEPVVQLESGATLRGIAGASLVGHLGFTVREGYHVQANPANGAFLIPFELTLQDSSGALVGDVVISYPAAQTLWLQGSDTPLWTYEGNFEVVVQARLDADLPPGSHVVQGAVRYQACTSHRCLFPTTESLSVRIVVGDPPSE